MTAATLAKERDEFTCRKCGREGDSQQLHAHHIHPEAAGGSDDLENLVTLCGHCHRFAPEFRDAEKARRVTEAYISTGVRPEFNLFYMGAEYGLRTHGEPENVAEATEVLGRVSDAFENVRARGDRVPKKPRALYEMMLGTWKS